MIVQNKSNLTVTCDAGAATAKKGASITQYSITVNGVTKTLTAAGGSVNFGVINSKTNLTLSAKVTDSRGNVSSAVNKTITCYEYYTPSFTSFNAYRCDANGEATLDGTYIKWDYDVNYASVNNKNRCTTKIYGTPSGSGSATSSGSKIQVNDDGTYKIYAIATDAFGGTTQSLVDVVYGPVRVLNISQDGSNIAIGKIVDGYDDEGVLDCRWKIKTGDPANTMRNLTYRGDNLIGPIANDTTANWRAQGNLATAYYYQSGQLTGQPAQDGYVVNISNGPANAQIQQLWMTQPSGSLYHRGGDINGWSGTWKKIVDATTLYNSSEGTTGTVTLNDSAEKYSYLEIFYKDNNSNGHNSIKVYSPHGKKIDISTVEPSDGNIAITFIRRSLYAISGTSITPSVATCGYVKIDGTSVTHTIGVNYLTIVRVIGCN
jgi:hypothetical protein